MEGGGAASIFSVIPNLALAIDNRKIDSFWSHDLLCLRRTLSPQVTIQISNLSALLIFQMCTV